jgi:hypothetical protein
MDPPSFAAASLARSSINPTTVGSQLLERPPTVYLSVGTDYILSLMANVNYILAS